MNPTDQQKMTIALGMGEGAVKALDTMAEAVIVFAQGRLPDQACVREALDAWGVTYKEGTPIHRTFGSTPALDIALPTGWSFSCRGGGGHNDLLDARGASRLHWYIHPWDNINVRVSSRFSIHRGQDLSTSESVIHVYDGPTVIHTEAIHYPHARISDPDEDGVPYYHNGNDKDGWTKDMRLVNYAACEAAAKAARDWLDEHRPGHTDNVTSWVL